MGKSIKCAERTVYYTDLNGMKAATNQNPSGIAQTSAAYFLISRQQYTSSGNQNRYCLTDSKDLTGVTFSDLCLVSYQEDDKTLREDSVGAGIRPVITLSGETLVIGSGTAQDPYVIQY